MGDLFIWFGVVMGTVMLSGAVLLVLRDKYRPGGKGRPEESAGFAMEQLESMLGSGQISMEEYRVLRRSALGLDAGVPCGNNAHLSTGGDDDDESKSSSVG